MQIGEHSVEFVDSLPAGRWWDVWPELMNIEADNEGRFSPFRVWDWEFVRTFLLLSVETWDGKKMDDPHDIPLRLMNALVLAAYNHVVGLFLQAQPSSET